MIKITKLAPILAPIFKALGGRLRLKIIEHVRMRSASSTELSRAFKMSAQALSYHISRLVACGILKSSVSGRSRVYSFNKGAEPFLLAAQKHAQKYCKAFFTHASPLNARGGLGNAQNCALKKRRKKIDISLNLRVRGKGRF